MDEELKPMNDRDTIAILENENANLLAAAKNARLAVGLVKELAAEKLIELEMAYEYLEKVKIVNPTVSHSDNFMNFQKGMAMLLSVKNVWKGFVEGNYQPPDYRSGISDE